MNDPRWLRLVTIGLVLAALAVGYMLFTGRFSSNIANMTKPSASPKVLGQNASVSPAPTGSPKATSPAPSATSAYNAIVNRTQGSTQTLPNTGLPLEIVIFSASGILIGWGLRRFPR